MARQLKTRRTKLLRGLLLVVMASVVGQLIGKRMTHGNENSDAFRLAAIGGGRELKSRATALRSASALAVMGGVEIDLREAALDPRGATLDVAAFMGGIEVTLPPGWAVDLVQTGKLAGVEARLTDSADLPDGSPRLRVTINAWLGGVEIRERPITVEGA